MQLQCICHSLSYISLNVTTIILHIQTFPDRNVLEYHVSYALNKDSFTSCVHKTRMQPHKSSKHYVQQQLQQITKSRQTSNCKHAASASQFARYQSRCPNHQQILPALPLQCHPRCRGNVTAKRQHLVACR